MAKLNSEIISNEKEALIFNAFSNERFFDYDDGSFSLVRQTPSVDKLAVIDEMLSANITELTHRSRQD